MPKSTSSPRPLPDTEIPITVQAAIHPLDEFYQEMGLALPPCDLLEGEAMPAPYKKLLVHRDDMTPTLERFYQRDIHLRVLGRRRRGDEYFREVVLLLDESNEPVEFGAIKIYLNQFQAAARTQILQEKRPLGHVLHECRIAHESRPQAYLRIASDKLINEALQLTGAHVLYGRRNRLLTLAGEPLADIVEVLPPARTRG
jgi:chorismate-pyruvate lyase